MDAIKMLFIACRPASSVQRGFSSQTRSRRPDTITIANRDLTDAYWLVYEPKPTVKRGVFKLDRIW